MYDNRDLDRQILKPTDYASSEEAWIKQRFSNAGNKLYNTTVEQYLTKDDITYSYYRGEETIEEINDKYDLAIFTTANIFNANPVVMPELEQFVAVINRFKIPVYILDVDADLFFLGRCREERCQMSQFRSICFAVKKNSSWVILVTVIFLQLLVAAFYMNIKQFYFVDELCCYEGAHNTMLYPFAQYGPPFRLDNSPDAFYKWVPKSEFMQHFEVRGEERLPAHSLSDIRQNIKVKNTYYILFNLLLSLWPNAEFTKWSGYALNAIIFIVHQIVLYLIGLEAFKDKKKALLPMILFGFSAGGITLVIFIRFYLFMSLLCLLIAYGHMILLKRRNVINIITAFAITAVATLSLYGDQPFIVLYVASAMFVFGIVCLLEKEYKLLLRYAGIGLVGVATVLMFAPSVLTRLSGMAESGWGQVVVENFLRKPFGVYAHYIRFYFMKTLSHVTAGVYGIAAVVLLLIIVWIIQGREKIRIIKPEYFSFQALYITGVSVCYFLVNSRIQWGEIYRYMTCVYAGLCVGIAVLLEWIMDSCKLRYQSIILCASVIIGLGTSYWRGYVDETYLWLADVKQCLAEYESVDNIIYIEPKESPNRYYLDGVMMNDNTKIYLMEPEDLDEKDYSFIADTYDQGILCWLPLSWEEDIGMRDYALDQILSHTGYNEYRKVFETDYYYQPGSSVYYVY